VKVYLAGGMTGIEFFNFPAFDGASAALRFVGHDVFSPAENDRRLLGKPANWLPSEADSDGPGTAWSFEGAPGIRKMLGDDVAYICHEADAIAMLPGWEHSRGARAEHALAVALGHKVMYL
jgi:hypothetical protein